MTTIISIALSYLATVAFGILINIPRKALHSCGLVGAFGWAIYLAIKAITFGVMLANVCSAFAIVIGAMMAAQRHRMPMILFNIPSLVPLVPGGQAYRAVQNFALGNNDLAIEYLIQVTMIAAAIAMGFLVAEIIAQAYFKFWTKQKR